MEIDPRILDLLLQDVGDIFVDKAKEHRSHDQGCFNSKRVQDLCAFDANVATTHDHYRCGKFIHGEEAIAVDAVLGTWERDILREASACDQNMLRG